MRPYQRFIIKGKTQGTGIDSSANYARFIMKESSLDVYRDSKMGSNGRTDPACQITPGKVPYGTTKCTYKIGLSPNAKLDRNGLNVETKSFPRNPTDQIS